MYAVWRKTTWEHKAFDHCQWNRKHDGAEMQGYHTPNTHKQRNTNASISLAAVLAYSGWIILGRKNKMHTQIRVHKNGLSN